MSTLLIHNATILSFHDGFTNGSADCIAVDENIIKAVGKYEDLQSLIHPHTQVIDAKGKTLMPGFNDSHIHIWKVGNLKTFMLDVRGVGSMDEMLELISNYIAANPHLQWITARGFNEAAWKDGVLPTKNDLDKVSNIKPIYLIRTCAHIAVCNSKALELCSIKKNTTVPEGGVMQYGEDGNPNGIFAETALGLISNKIPSYTKDDLKIMVGAVKEEMYSYGITAATDPAVDPLLLEAYHEMNDAGELGFRLNALPIILPDGAKDPYPIPEKYTSDFFNINTVKFFADGGLSGKTSALKRHYKNTGEQGILRLDKKQYTSLAMSAMEKGLGIATHAIGDAAIEMVIDTYRQLRQLHPVLPLRIEHLGLPEQKHLQAMKKNNIACSMQTIFLDELGKNFIKYLDKDYLQHCYPVKSVLQNGILMALSSDAPVVKNFNPFKGISAAVTRKNSEGQTIAPEEAISVSDALKAYTVSAAKISGLQNLGTLQEGKLADMILLDKNPLTVAQNELDKIQVLKTFVAGKEVWSAGTK